jgi:hypothetical protein
VYDAHLLPPNFPSRWSRGLDHGCGRLREKTSLACSKPPPVIPGEFVIDSARFNPDRLLMYWFLPFTAVRGILDGQDATRFVLLP